MLKKKRWAVLGLLAACLVWWLWWGNTDIQVTNVTVSDAALPEEFDGYRLAQVSDLHNTSFGRDNARLLEELAAAQPDAILLTGDLVDSRRTDVAVALSLAERAVDIAPVYYVTGNHEARLVADGTLDELLQGLADVGVTVLSDGAVCLERGADKLWLAGLEDPSFNWWQAGLDWTAEDVLTTERPLLTGDLAELLAQCDGYTVLLAHRPEYFDLYADAGAEVVFCGHAHGGQFRLPLLGAVYAPNQGLWPEYTEGVYRDGATQMVVSRGLGNSLFPLRLNNRPELVVAELSRIDNRE